MAGMVGVRDNGLMGGIMGVRDGFATCDTLAIHEKPKLLRGPLGGLNDNFTPCFKGISRGPNY